MAHCCIGVVSIRYRFRQCFLSLLMEGKVRCNAALRKTCGYAGHSRALMFKAAPPHDAKSLDRDKEGSPTNRSMSPIRSKVAPPAKSSASIGLVNVVQIVTSTAFVHC